MLKLITEILNSKVILFQEGRQIGWVSELIFDPGNGDFLGFFVLGLLEKQNIIPANEIKAIGSGFVVAKDQNSLSEADDVVKIREALKIRPRIIKEKVFTESGQYLGRVNDGTIDITHSCLERIYVNPPLSLKRMAKQLMIPAKKIIEIKKDKIVVSDEFVRSKAKVAGLGLAVNK